MVRKGSPVRVRQRASQTAAQRGFFVSGAATLTAFRHMGKVTKRSAARRALAGGPVASALAEARGRLLIAEGADAEGVAALRRAAEGRAAVGQRLPERRARGAGWGPVGPPPPARGAGGPRAAGVRSPRMPPPRAARNKRGPVHGRHGSFYALHAG